jgi:predicted RNase H-like nuclease (RuvC/YqgF family)
MSKEQTRPSESLVQELLNERRQLKIAVERMKLELADAQAAGGGGAGVSDQRVREMQDEIERLRYQLATTRAEATQLREERDALRAGIEKALGQLSSEDAEE